MHVPTETKIFSTWVASSTVSSSSVASSSLASCCSSLAITLAFFAVKRFLVGVGYIHSIFYFFGFVVKRLARLVPIGSDATRSTFLDVGSCRLGVFLCRVGVFLCIVCCSSASSSESWLETLEEVSSSSGVWLMTSLIFKSLEVFPSSKPYLETPVLFPKLFS